MKSILTFNKVCHHSRCGASFSYVLLLNFLHLVFLIFFPENIKNIFNSSNSLSFGSFS
jgi:hypothetical protein